MAHVSNETRFNVSFGLRCLPVVLNHRTLPIGTMPTECATYDVNQKLLPGSKYETHGIIQTIDTCRVFSVGIILLKIQQLLMVKIKFVVSFSGGARKSVSVVCGNRLC